MHIARAMASPNVIFSVRSRALFRRGSAWTSEGIIDCVCEVAHRLELEVVAPSIRRLRCGSPTGTVVTAVDPYRRQPLSFCRDVVVEEALGDVEQVGAAYAELGESIVQSAEVVLGRLVGTDVLRGDDGGEVAVQLLVALGEAVAMYVGEDDQGVALCQPP